jgi:hypothetical protein
MGDDEISTAAVKVRAEEQYHSLFADMRDINRITEADLSALCPQAYALWMQRSAAINIAHQTILLAFTVARGLGRWK